LSHFLTLLSYFLSPRRIARRTSSRSLLPFLTPAGHREFQPLAACLTQQPTGLTAERVAAIREFAVPLPAMRERFVERAAYLLPSAPIDQVGSLCDEYSRTLEFWRPGGQLVPDWDQRRWAYDAGSAQLVFAAASGIGWRASAPLCG
jgi:hypothetical protein